MRGEKLQRIVFYGFTRLILRLSLNIVPPFTVFIDPMKGTHATAFLQYRDTLFELISAR